MCIGIDRSARILGFVAVALTIALSLPGIGAVRADDAAPAVREAPEADASFEGFARYMQREGRSARVESSGPTCNVGSPIQVEMAHRRAIAEMQARMIAEARAAAAADGGSPDVVVLNGSGYNYRSADSPSPAPPSAGGR